MTTGAMDCDRFTDRLMDYLEQDLDVATRASVEGHAADCAECGALLADIRKLRADAGSLPELKPSRDLWTGIAARIETPVVPIGAGAASTTFTAMPRRHMRRWINSALVAASLMAAATLGYTARGANQQVGHGDSSATQVERQIVPPVAVADPRTTRIAPVDSPALSRDVATAGVDRGTAATPRAGGTTPAPAGAPAVEVQLAAAALSADYDREIARLRTLIEQRRSQLDPATVTVIERNLAVIDTAIAESRAAIVNDPNSRFLLDILNQSLQAKVELMRTAALLPSRT